MIAAVVLTKNEQENIKACLKTLGWTDEILVVDDFSTDKTMARAQKMGARVFRRRLNDDFAAQRNFALRQTKGAWVLFVDADERISQALAQEIKTVIQKTTKKGFFLKRRDYLWGKYLKHGEPGRIKLLRLAKKGAGEWTRRVHETWQIKGAVGQLKNPLFHCPHPSLKKFLKHINFHSTLHAKAHQETGIKASLWRIVFLPLAKFGKNYFLRFGFLDGLVGLAVALLMSFHSFLAWSKLYVDH